MHTVLENSAIVTFFLANLFYASAYLVKDILWLRILSIAAALLTFPYFLVQSSVMYSALFWQTTFATINLVHIAMLLRARCPVPLTADQQLIKDMVLRNFTSREAHRLLQVATWHDAKTDKVLIHKDQESPKLYLLKTGKVEIRKNDEVIAHRGPGSFLGELNYMTGEPAMADVIFSADSAYLCWDKVELQSLLNKNSGIQVAFKALITANIATKLGHT